MSARTAAQIKALEDQVADLLKRVAHLEEVVRWGDPEPIPIPPPPAPLREAGLVE